MSVTPESIAHLSPQERRALLARLLQEKVGGRKTFPLSFAQARLWVLDRFLPGNPTYNVPLVMRLPGPLDTSALERSLNEIVRRHETLRTTFALEDGKPVQVVAPSLELKMHVVDLSSLKDEREAEANRMAFEESVHSFDLTRGPLIRATLLRLAPTDHLFILVMHHIISDGWSLKVFHHELSTLYLAYLRGQPSPLPELPIQYADFTQWQANWLSGETLERQLSYWRSQLAGIQPVIDLPADRPRPPMQSHRGALHAFSIEPHVSEHLHALSQRAGVTPFMTLLAAFTVLLSRYSGETDIVVGTPIANRTRRELEPLIGFFVNTLVLRTELSGDPTFRELMGRVREVTLGAYAHQDMPFEKLVEELQPERNLGHNPLFQVMFTLQTLDPNGRVAAHPDNPQPPADAPPIVNGTSKFDLTIALAETGRGIQGVAEYNTDLFDALTIARMCERFQLLLQGIVQNPDQRLSRLPITGEMERRSLAAGWSGAEVEQAREQTVCEMVAAHARRTPEAVAVSSEQTETNYRDLNHRANQLAHKLRAYGVSRGTTVGVLLESPTETVVALLGVLKSGGAYVLLDPSEPPLRWSFILEDAGARVVVSEERFAEHLSQRGARVLWLDRERERLAQESDEEPDAGVSLDDLAALLYESSPAGRTEGIMQTHRALGRTVFERELRITASDRIAQYPSPFGSAACLSLFGALAAGAQVVCMPGRTPAPPRKLAALLRDREVTMLSAPASMLEHLAREFPWALRTVRVILCDDRLAAFNQLRATLEADLLKRVYGCYSATEAGGPCAIQSLAATLPSAGGETVGQPVEGARLYLLDTLHEPVPQGVPGEIYVGTEALAHGYHRQPARTAETFIPDPYSGTPGARLYRTGDLARSMPDGSIRYLRRRDGRFVTRGMRVEPEEIEAALLLHPAVGEAVVVARRAQHTREGGITAFVVADEGQVVGVEDLRRFLKERLPEAMLPATFTLLEKLPRDRRGEADRRALADIADASDNPGVAPAYVAPRNELEERLANIWAETFGVERVGINDSFFRLGGHSLLATQVVARVSDLFEVDLPLVSLFETPTIAGLSKVVGELVEAGTKVKPPAIMRMPRQAVRLPVEPDSPR